MWQLQDTFFCNNCQNNILKKCQTIHQQACFKQKEHNKQNQIGFFRKIFYSDKKRNQNEELIPCTQCGQSVPFQIFVNHQEECVGHQLTICSKCSISFPTFLFDDHLQVCQGKFKIKTQSKASEFPSPLSFNFLEKKGPQNYPPVNPSQFLVPPKRIRQQAIKLEDSGSDEDEELMKIIEQLANKQIKNQKLTENPLTSQQIKKLATIRLNKSEECSVCCCEMITKIKHIKLGCKHHFHKRCINSWLKKNPYCPMCRQHALKQ